MDFQDLKKLDEKFVLQTYGRYPLELVRGSGCKVWDSEGKEYLDMLGGIACLPLGHAHPKLVKAIREQAEKLMHVSNLYYMENQARLAEMLSDLAPLKTKAFFSNSGAEANEAAIKFARKNTKRSEIIAMSNSFHGRTMGSLAITDKKKYQKPFEPLMPETEFVEYGSIESLKNAINGDTAAVFVEFVQGEGGIRFPKDGLGETIEYIKGIREACDDSGALMVMDEVQTGVGRSGKFFACEHAGIAPDIITTAKGIASGFPMGVTLVSEDIASSIEKGDHGSTFGGGPLACAAGIATVETILDGKLMENAAKVGKHLLGQSDFGKARGLGLMIGVDVGTEDKAKSILKEARSRGVLVNVTAQSIIRMLPPLILTKREADFAVGHLREAAK